jgi:hypothetical protein
MDWDPKCHAFKHVRTLCVSHAAQFAHNLNPQAHNHTFLIRHSKITLFADTASHDSILTKKFELIEFRFEFFLDFKNAVVMDNLNIDILI